MKNENNPILSSDEKILSIKSDLIDAFSMNQIELDEYLDKIQKKYKVKRSCVKNILKDLKKKQSNKNLEYLMSENNSVSLPEGVLIPENYTCRLNGVFKVKIDNEGEVTETIISPQAIYLSKIINDLDSQNISYELMFYFRKSFRSVIVSAKDISTTSGIIDLANKGLMVTCNNSTSLIRYLYDQRAVSEHFFKIANCTRNIGWGIFNNKTHFILGNNIFQVDNEIERNSSDQDNSILKQFYMNGKSVLFYDTLNNLKKYPIALFAQGVVLAGPWCKILNRDNFIFHIGGESTGGKTTALKAAFSLVGNPSGSDGLGLTWRTTDNGVEARAKIFNGLCIPLDDSSQASNQNIIQNTIYFISNKKSKSRMKKNIELRQSVNFSGTALSTGEGPIINSTSKTGASVRVIKTKQEVFGKRDKYMSDFVKKINESLSLNFGFATEDYFNYLIKVANSKKLVEIALFDYNKIRMKRIKGIENHYVLRLIDSIALVEFAIIQMIKSLPLFKITQDEIDNAINLIIKEQIDFFNEEKDIGFRALSFIWDKIETNPARFNHNRILELSLELWGSLVVDENGQEAFAIVKSRVSNLLKEGGFPESCLQFFKERNYVWMDKNNKGLKPVRLWEKTCRPFSFDISKAQEEGIFKIITNNKNIL